MKKSVPAGILLLILLGAFLIAAGCSSSNSPAPSAPITISPEQTDFPTLAQPTTTPKLTQSTTTPHTTMETPRPVIVAGSTKKITVSTLPANAIVTLNATDLNKPTRARTKKCEVESDCAVNFHCCTNGLCMCPDGTILVEFVDGAGETILYPK